MKSKRTVKSKVKKTKAVHHVKKSYSLVEGNSNEFLLILAGSAFVIMSIIYFLGRGI